MKVDWSFIKDILLAALAVYGAVLSTFNWRQAAKRERRTLLVKISTVMADYHGRLGPRVLRVEAINVGARPVTATVLALELPGKKRMFSFGGDGLPGVPDTTLPAVLSDGMSAHIHLAYADIARALLREGHSSNIKVRPVAEDSAGGLHYGDPLDVDPHDFSRV